MPNWKILTLIALAIILSFIFYFPVIFSGNNLGIQDWDQTFSWMEFTRLSLASYRQFPWWNPFKCGGMPHFANPQMPVLTIQTLFALLFGTITGIKFSIFFHGIVCFLGFFLLGRQYKLSYTGSLIAATLFSFSGITGSFLSTGMVVFTNFAYTPYILFFLNKSQIHWKWGILAGVIFALSFYAGIHIPLLLFTYIVIFSLITSVLEKSMIPLKRLVIMLFSSLILSLPKLLLSIQLLLIYPRQVEEESGYTITNFFYFLLAQKQNLFSEMDIRDYSYTVDENSLYIGLLALILFFIFFIKNNKAVLKNMSLPIVSFIFFWLMLGNNISPSLYLQLQHLPVFSAFRVAQRFRFDFIIPFALLAGGGLDNLQRLLSNKSVGRILGILLFLLIYINLTIFSHKNFLTKTLIIANPDSLHATADEFVQTQKKELDLEYKRTIQLPSQFLQSNIFLPWSDEYLKIKQMQGTLECYDPIPVKVKAISIEEDKYQGEFYLARPTQTSEIVNVFWSPNKLSFKIDKKAETKNNRLIINQNYYPGWIVRKKNGSCLKVINHKGLIAADFNFMSDDLLTFEYNPPLANFICK